MDDVDGGPGDPLGPRTGRSKCPPEIAKYMARRCVKITLSNQLAVYVLGLPARDEYHLAPRRNDDLRVRLRNGQILGIDAFERH
ncbi:hypothetical protein [Burkholderia sp. BCC1644]|uniref:hypothetical protein n=1 Tax=Burkholderia sp. BCC1644 TaxID=2676293 RepID=UPI001FC80107|nr:hypothetical protein [Burkholderia sp. BCC1644]